MRSGRVLAMDETSLEAGREARGKMRKGWLWPVYGHSDEVVFHDAPSRAHRHVHAFLGEYCATLLSDGYEAYATDAAQRPAQVTHALCWAHTRRHFERAEDAEPEAAAASPARTPCVCRRVLRLIRRAMAAPPSTRKSRQSAGRRLRPQTNELQASKRRPAATHRARVAPRPIQCAVVAVRTHDPFAQVAGHVLKVDFELGVKAAELHPPAPQCFQRLMRTPHRPESIRALQKALLVHRLQHPPHRALKPLVRQRRNADRARLARPRLLAQCCLDSRVIRDSFQSAHSTVAHCKASARAPVRSSAAAGQRMQHRPDPPHGPGRAVIPRA